MIEGGWGEASRVAGEIILVVLRWFRAAIQWIAIALAAGTLLALDSHTQRRAEGVGRPPGESAVNQGRWWVIALMTTIASGCMSWGPASDPLEGLQAEGILVIAHRWYEPPHSVEKIIATPDVHGGGDCRCLDVRTESIPGRWMVVAVDEGRRVALVFAVDFRTWAHLIPGTVVATRREGDGLIVVPVGPEEPAAAAPRGMKS